MSETRNIVVLGASFAGLSAAHYIAKHTLPQLAKSKDAKYELHIVDPSTHFWWNVSAPRAIVSVKEMPHDKTFVPIADGFKQYPALKDSIHFHHGEAAGLDTTARTVQIKAAGSETTQTIPYYALIIATGVRSPTALTTFQGDYTLSTKALDAMNTKLASAKDILIVGGGPVGVETAGEIGTHLKGKAKITLATGSDKLLPVLRPALATKAQKQLEKVGVDVVYNARVTGSHEAADGKTEVSLSDGTTRTVDVYIPAFGVTPNTAYLPENLKQDSGFVKTNGATLRVDEAGPRVYALGDVAGVDKGGIMNLFNVVPVWGANFNHDILGENKLGNVAEKAYKRSDAETQIVPIGASSGVGAFNGFGFPSFMISFIKGKNYMVGNMPQFTQGTKWVKA